MYESKDWIANEKYNSHLGLTLFEMIKCGTYEPNKYLKKKRKDISLFWEAFFESGNNDNFELLLINFLLKASTKIENVPDNQTSAYYAGRTVLTILQHVHKTEKLENYKK